MVQNNFGPQKDKAKDYCSMKGHDSKVQNCPNSKLFLAKIFASEKKSVPYVKNKNSFYRSKAILNEPLTI